MRLDMRRRGFLKSAASIAALTAGGSCNAWSGRSGKIRLAVVGVMGKGYSDWTPMLKSGMVDIVAFCDADYKARERAQLQLIKDGIDLDIVENYLGKDYRSYLSQCAEKEIKNGRLTINGTHISLTRQGLYVSNDVMAELVKV